MGAIKNYYFSEINAEPDESDYLYQLWLEEQRNAHWQYWEQAEGTRFLLQDGTVLEDFNSKKSA